MSIVLLAEPTDDPLEHLRRDAADTRDHVNRLLEALRLERLLNP